MAFSWKQYTPKSDTEKTLSSFSYLGAFLYNKLPAINYCIPTLVLQTYFISVRQSLSLGSAGD